LENKTRLLAYAAVLVIFVFAVSTLTSNRQETSPSGYIIAKQDESASKANSLNQIDDVQKQLDKLKLDINTFSSNLTSCYSNTGELTSNLQNCKKDVALCNTELTKLNANKSAGEQTCLNDKTSLQLNLSFIGTKLAQATKDLSNLTTEHDALEKQYSALSANAANNICCKTKVDNPNVKYYSIENDKIACKETSGIPISC